MGCAKKPGILQSTLLFLGGMHNLTIYFMINRFFCDIFACIKNMMHKEKKRERVRSA